MATSAKLNSNGALKQSHNLFPEDKTIYFCNMQGPIHASHCISCPDFSDPKIKPGSRHRRNPSYCKHKAGTEIGRLVGDELHLKSQEEIDKEINEELGLGKWNDARLVLPLHETDIRSAYLGDIPRWDGLRYGLEFCFRCGPKQTSGVLYRCNNCGDRRLCDNCLVNRTEKVEADNTRTISYQCPSCMAENCINLGSDDRIAYFYPVNKETADREWNRKEIYFPLDYHFVNQRFRYARNQNRTLQPQDQTSETFTRCPSPHAIAFELNQGAVTGRFWIDQKDRLAWVEISQTSAQSLLFTRSPKGIVPSSFTHDMVLSYRTADVCGGAKLVHGSGGIVLSRAA